MYSKISTKTHFLNEKLRITCRLSYNISVLRLIFCTIILSVNLNTAWAGDTSTGGKQWVGTWATARQLVEPNNMPPAPGLSNNTLRQVICVSIGGKRLQMKFSNEFGKSPLTMKVVQIAVSKGESLIDESTTKMLTFNGLTEVTIQPGTEITSDPLSFNLKPRTEVAITIAFGETSPTLTGHPGSRTTSYLIANNQTSKNTDYTHAINTDHWYVICGMEVESSASAVAIIGDSITDGRGSGANKQNRWTDIFSMNLLKSNPGKQTGVLNLGIGGNCVLRGGLGPTALNRFDHDILQQKGVKWLIIFEGVNDLGSTRDSAAASKVASGLIAAYKNMITEAHARGMKVYGGTITPIKDSFYYKDFRETARNTVNEWIRKSGNFDAVIDFDKVLEDPKKPFTILSEAQSGDNLHPNELGYKLMGEAVNIDLFR